MSNQLKSSHSSPIHIAGESTRKLAPIDDFNEAYIQNLLFDHPHALPIAEIDDAYLPLVPVCTELSTPVGPLDVLYVTPRGRLIVAEAKLWKNPEARRKVVAQILDYAKELALWDYEDLQREVNKRLKSSGNTLFRLASEADTEGIIDEASFVDAVSRNLQHGRFLLLIVGDGIREGAANLTDFLATAGHLEFSLGLIELAVYELSDEERIVVPRTIAKTFELQRVVVEVPNGLQIRSSEQSLSPAPKHNTASTPERDQERAFYQSFWRELVESLELDDPGQPRPEPANAQNLYLYLPTKQCWISAYFSKSSRRVGVYFRCSKSPVGNRIREELAYEQELIEAELGLEDEIFWNMGEELGGTGVRLPCDDIFAPSNRKEIVQFFQIWINRFVNVFRPRVKRLEVNISD